MTLNARPEKSPLLRFMAVNCALGIAAGWIFLTALFVTDAWGLATRIANAADPIVPLVMLFAIFAITFGAAAMGTAVMLMPGARRDRDGVPENTDAE